MLNIIIFGAPGAGKGTQSKFIIQTYNLNHLSTGDLLREEVRLETELGLKAKPIMEAGNYVSDEIIIGMIENKFRDNSMANGFIFDGFPRTVAQAEALDSMLLNQNTNITAVILLEVEESELVKRILKRAIDEGRTDDNVDSVLTRLRNYHHKTIPVVDYYRAKGKLLQVNGVGLVEDIFDQIKEFIDHSRYQL